MVVGNNFAKVREAFCANLAENLRRLNVEIKSHTAKGDWLQINCPFCGDKSGSASCSVNSGMLRCHQCSMKADLFTWVGKSIGTDLPWMQCQMLAKVVGIEVEGAKRQAAKYKVVPELTEETWSDFKQRLYEDDDAELPREFLKRRGFWLPAQLEELPIGAFGGKLILAQHNGDGKLLRRCRVYDPFPMADQQKWSWNKVKTQKGRTVGFWPMIPRIYEADPHLLQLILEGEWDVLAAILKLGVLDKGVICMTWTGGGGAPIPMDGIHEFMRGRETHLLYDNDVFQGLGDDVAPNDTKLAEMRVRKKTFLDVTAPAFAANRCTVFIRAIPMNPMTHWGADLRDMVDGGLQTIDDLPIYKLADCRRQLRVAKRVEFAEVHAHIGQYVEFRCQVAGVSDDVSIKMHRASVTCEMGQHPYCQWCRLPTLAPNGVLDFAAAQSELACAMTDRNMQQNLMERYVGKPGTCKVWRMNPEDFSDGSRWSAMAREDDTKEGTRTVEILSNDVPPLSGDLLVRGWLYISANGLTPVLMCDHLEAADRVVLPIEPHRADILINCPTDTTDPKEIDGYLDRWSRDIANNTTHVYGRRDIHIMLGLTMHSALWMDVLGARRRAWLDVCMIGATRTGKSAATRAYLKAIGIGQQFTPMGNYSRAGLTIGTLSMNGQSKMRPGVFPRNHAKLLAIDEAHLMLAENPAGGGLFPMLQGARDIGKVEAAKISGTQMLNAAVRLIAIANWLDGSRNSFATPAQHLLELYGTPESLARLDFGLPVDELAEGQGPEEVVHIWTPERQRVLAIRAWQLQPAGISFEDEAIELAQHVCTTTWKDRYSEEVPLYTEKEKVYSILRIAIAIANMTVSSGDNLLASCRVRLVHVQWAIGWLEHTWNLLEYDSVSRTSKRSLEPRLAWRVEALLTCHLKLADPTAVNFTIGKFFGIMAREELRAMTGLNLQEFEQWTVQLVRAGALEVIKPKGNVYGNSMGLRFTRGAIVVIQQLVKLAEQAPEVWSHRYGILSNWHTTNSGLVKTVPESLLPIDAPIEMHLNANRQQRLYD